MDLPVPLCAVVASTMPVTPRPRLLYVPSARMYYRTTFPRFPRYPLMLVVLQVAGAPNEGRLVPPTSRLTRLTPVTLVIEVPMKLLLDMLLMNLRQEFWGNLLVSLARCLVPKLTLVMNYLWLTSRCASLQFSLRVSFAMTVTCPLPACLTTCTFFRSCWPAVAW